ncbi:MAG: gamma-glutamylcyclotransferase [Alicyclobacillus sp.]|nr:gamma-glutamylcyclotransferase [Alicyclobacillus sp.]
MSRMSRRDQAIPRVFVYGTLRSGQFYHDRIARDVIRCRRAYVKGRLYHLPFGYPALILDEAAGKVWGEVLEFDRRTLRRVLSVMDDIEGYGGPGEDNEYDRVVRPVHLEEAQAVECHLYVCPDRSRAWVEEHGVLVPCGDWVAWRWG